MKIEIGNLVLLAKTKFLSMIDMEYAPGQHYVTATRRQPGDIVALKSDEEFIGLIPDAVTCIVVLETPDGPKLLLSYEYRYPLGRFVLSPPAGLIDEKDRKEARTIKPILAAAVREIKEETGLMVKDNDTVCMVNQCVFSAPGMTDESNALVYAKIKLDDYAELSQKGAEGSELFDGFELLTKAEAREILERGRDKHGNFYPVYTWAALTYFVSGMTNEWGHVWKGRDL